MKITVLPPRSTLLMAEGLFPIQFLLWELVLGDVAEAELIEAAVS